MRLSTETTYLLYVRCPTTAPSSQKNKSLLWLSHGLFTFTSSLSAVFASVISLTIFSRFSLSVELEGAAKYLQVREIRKLCNAAPATETWRERRVGMNYTCFRGGLQICPNKCTRGNDCDISSYNARLLNMKGANYSFPPKVISLKNC